jgi:NAD(P)-dependent dehydrogenase (short-subunit alcohol dehydrogenase family)
MTRRVVITGAGGGLGPAVARRLAAGMNGRRLVLHP